MQTIDCSKVRGFNYQPSYVRNGLDSWIDRFDAATVEREIGIGKGHFPGINTLRLWLSFDAFIIDPKTYFANFETVLSIGEKFGIRFIPTIFNAWHSIPDFGGVCIEQLLGGKTLDIFRPYVEGLVGPHASDPRILAWDLCNEPFNSCPSDDTAKYFVDWLADIRAVCDTLSVQAPIGVGACPAINQMRLLEPFSDILMFHPYFAWNHWVPEKSDYIEFLDSAVAFAKEVGKDLLATETCWGSLDDMHRSEIVRFELSEQKKRGIGWCAHLLYHSQVADANRRWQPPNIGAGYMAFVEADGSLRPGHGVFNDF